VRSKHRSNDLAGDVGELRNLTLEVGPRLDLVVLDTRLRIVGRAAKRGHDTIREDGTRQGDPEIERVRGIHTAAGYSKLLPKAAGHEIVVCNLDANCHDGGGELSTREVNKRMIALVARSSVGASNC